MNPDLSQLQILARLADLEGRVQGLEALDRLVQSFGEELTALVFMIGLPTQRTLAAGLAPGAPDSLVGQMLGGQQAQAELHALVAGMDARLRVIIRAGKSQEQWSPSRLQRELDDAHAAAVENVRQAQARALERVMIGNEDLAAEINKRGKKP